jgi:hypothetical protein
LVSEDLPPVRVGAVDSEFLRSTIGLDIPGLVVQSSLDSSRFLIEPPELSLSSISSLDDNVSVVDEVEISSSLHS